MLEFRILTSSPKNKKTMKEKETNIEHILEQRFGAERIKAWKGEFAPRKLNVILVEDKVAVLRPVKAAELSRYSMMVADPESGLDKAGRYLMDALWLDGVNAIRDDEEYFMAAMLQLQNTIELKKSTYYRL